MSEDIRKAAYDVIAHRIWGSDTANATKLARELVDALQDAGMLRGCDGRKISPEKHEELRQRMMDHKVVNDVAIVELTARELQELLEALR